MPNPVAVNDSALISGSLQTARVSYGVDTAGKNYGQNFNGNTWFSDIPNNGTFYTIISDSYTANYYFSRSNAEGSYIEGGLPGTDDYGSPVFWVTPGLSSLDVITIVNGLPDRRGQIPFNSGSQALNWIASSSNYFAVGPDYYPQVDADNLQLYLDANQVISYPTTASTWYDLSGNIRNSTLVNGPVWNSNGWVEFDGADDRSTTSFGFLSNNESHEAWIYSKGNVSTYNMFMGIILPYYGFFGGNTFIIQDLIGGAQVGYYTGTLSLNRWYHFLSTRSYNGTNTTLVTYINGILSAQQTYSGAPGIAGGTWAIGNWDAPSAGASYPFYGDISGVKFYSKALTAAEVAQNYYGGPIVTNGLVFAVDAGNLVSYPKSGTSVYNLTGSGATGTLTNGTSFTPSDGGAFVFDGTNDYISFPNDTNLNSQTITMESWINPNSIFQNGFLFEKGQVNSQYSNFFNSDGTFYFRTMGLSTQDLTFYIPSYISINTWNHIVCTYGAGVKTIYLNGVQVAQQTGLTGTISTNATGLFLGAYGPGTGYFLNGKIAESRVYNRALTAAEVLQNYNATK